MQNKTTSINNHKFSGSIETSKVKVGAKFCRTFRSRLEHLPQ